MTALTWVLLISAMLTAAVLLIGWSMLSMSAHLDQQDEDTYGVEAARRS